MVLSRDYLPACSWQPTYSSKSVGAVGRIWSDMYVHPVFWWLSSVMSACAAWEGDSPQWDHITTAELPPGLVTAQRGNGSTIFPAESRGPRWVFKGAETIQYHRSGLRLLLVPRAPCWHTWTISDTQYITTHSASYYTQASGAGATALQASGGPLGCEWQPCGFKRELVHPAAEKPVDSAVFLPHFPFCSDLTLPQCRYSCGWSGTLHTKVSFSHINMSI